MALSPTALGIASAMGASMAFSVNDMAIKFLSGDYALHQVILIRSCISVLLILCIFLPLQGGLHLLRTRRPGIHLLRGICVVSANMCFFLGLSVLPLAEAVAIFFVSPLVITVFSVVFLGETVGPRRWAAVIVGLLGVIVILRPGTEAFQPAALLVLAAAALYAALHTLTRHIGVTESAASLAFYAQSMFIVVGIGFGLTMGDGRFAELGGDGPLAFLFRGWVWPQGSDWAILVLVGLSSGLGAFLISNAYKLCEAALAAPFEYIGLPMAVLWGVAVFGEWPDLLAWIGISMILSGGVYMGYRETVLARQRATQ